MSENHLAPSLVSTFMGQHGTPYRDPWKENCLDFGIINAFTQTWYDPKGTFLNLETNEYNSRKDIKRRTAACSDSSALYTRGRTSEGGVGSKTTFTMEIKTHALGILSFQSFLEECSNYQGASACFVAVPL